MIPCLLTLLCCLTFEPCLGCHWTNIVVRNGTWCCGHTGKPDDTIKNVSTPPTPPKPPTTTTPTPTSPPEPHPIGDCPCGQDIEGMEMAMKKWGEVTNNKSMIDNRVLSQDPEFTPYLVRPWVVRIVITKDSGENIDCSGSILNKRYIITAAHCFCSNLVVCSTDHQGVKNIHELAEEPRLGTHLMLHLGNLKLKTNITQKGIQKLIIHPNYRQMTSESVVGHTDVALIKTNNDLFEMLPNNTIRGKSVQPICLPPKLGYDPRKNQAHKKIFEAFEDMDCRVIKGFRDKKAPYPYTKEDFEHLHLPSHGWLECHPAKYTNAWQTNIVGRSTFITSYGSTSREDFHENVRYQCSTNSYGPADSIFSLCHSKCHKKLMEPVEIKIPKFPVCSNSPLCNLTIHSTRERTKYVTEGNPSWADETCIKFLKEKMHEVGPIFEEELKKLGMGKTNDSVGMFNPSLIWIKIVDTDKDKTEHMCYPWPYDEKQNNLIRNMFDVPLKHGWCETCKEGSTHKCMPEPNKGWGWCQPQCDEEMYPPVENLIHEAAVDSFKYEGCSINFNMNTELCTAAPAHKGYGQVWSYNGKDFKLIQKELRVLHDPVKDEFTETRQHTNNVGDVCYGDAGGSVWKFWVFRDNDKKAEIRKHKLAVLTGVISRFEEQCGWMNPIHSNEHHNYKSKQTTSTRITAIHDWINYHIKDGRCQEKKSTDKPKDGSMDEEEVYMDDMYSPFEDN